MQIIQLKMNELKDTPKEETEKPLWHVATNILWRFNPTRVDVRY